MKHSRVRVRRRSLPWHPRHTCLLTGKRMSGVHLSAADMTTPGGDKAGTRNIHAPGGGNLSDTNKHGISPDYDVDSMY